MLNDPNTFIHDRVPWQPVMWAKDVEIGQRWTRCATRMQVRVIDVDYRYAVVTNTLTGRTWRILRTTLVRRYTVDPATLRQVTTTKEVSDA